MAISTCKVKHAYSDEINFVATTTVVIQITIATDLETNGIVAVVERELRNIEDGIVNVEALNWLRRETGVGDIVDGPSIHGCRGDGAVNNDVRFNHYAR